MQRIAAILLGLCLIGGAAALSTNDYLGGKLNDVAYAAGSLARSAVDGLGGLWDSAKDGADG
jgi:hypothetical protein